MQSEMRTPIRTPEREISAIAVEPGRRLGHHRVLWLPYAVLAAGAMFAAYGLQPVVGYPMWMAVLLTIGGLVLVVGCVVFGVRYSWRQRLIANLVEGLQPLARWPYPDHRAVEVRRWSKRKWPGVPRVIWIHYHPSAATQEVEWAGEVLRKVGDLAGGSYVVAARDAGRCRLTVKLGAAEETDQAPQSQQRLSAALEDVQLRP